jgi:bacteriophage CI repressor helix-turn-helix domain|nr:MAG TPA: helix-turn-helix domain protein [Bacteriophage sp.]
MLFYFSKGGDCVNKRIKLIRTTLGMTQQEFADKIKVKRNTVATYEMGRSIPSDSAIALICKVFDVNEDWLRTGYGEMFKEVSKSDQIADMLSDVLKSDENNFKRRLISALAQLDDTGWDSLEHLIDSIAYKKSQG